VHPLWNHAYEIDTLTG